MTTKRRPQRAPRVAITVTANLIEAAKRRDSSHCMIAEAIKAAVPNAKSVAVDLQTIRWTDPDKGLRYTYLTPRNAQVALVMFDQGDEGIEPFSFRLRAAQVTLANTKKGRKAAGTTGVTKKAQLVNPNTSVTQGEVATRIGGKTPPIGPLSNVGKRAAGRRREFGLRGLAR